VSFLYQVDSNSPATLHKHAKLHASSSHSFAFQEASLVQEVGDMVWDLAVEEGEPACGVRSINDLKS